MSQSCGHNLNKFLDEVYLDSLINECRIRSTSYLSMRATQDNLYKVLI
jgi:hypothetical protein